MDPWIGLALVVGLGAGVGIGFWLRRGSPALVVAAEARACELERRLDQAASELERRRDEATRLAMEKAGIEARLAAEAEASAARLAELKAVRADLDERLAATAAAALQSNQAAFLSLAETRLQPVSDLLRQYQERLDAIEKARVEGFGALGEHLRLVAEGQSQVRAEAARLVTALRAAPKTRGRWGEETLRRVMELSGLVQHVDFDTEVTFERDEERLRPDAVIRLPGGRTILVDAKTSLDAYLAAVDAADEAERERLLREHARQIRTHMKGLAGKAYWKGREASTDFVAMFVPGENFYAAAVERDPALFQDAIEERVLVVTPTTLIALARAVAYGWRQEKVAESAREVHRLGRELYRRLQPLGSHIVDLGRDLDKAVQRYNAFIGSLEGQVMPAARRFAELEIEGSDKPLPQLEPIERDVREARRDRDLTFDGQAAE